MNVAPNDPTTGAVKLHVYVATAPTPTGVVEPEQENPVAPPLRVIAQPAVPVGETALVGPVTVAVNVSVAPKITGDAEAVTTTDGEY